MSATKFVTKDIAPRIQKLFGGRGPQRASVIAARIEVPPVVVLKALKMLGAQKRGDKRTCKWEIARA